MYLSRNYLMKITELSGESMLFLGRKVSPNNIMFVKLLRLGLYLLNTRYPPEYSALIEHLIYICVPPDFPVTLK